MRYTYLAGLALLLTTTAYADKGEEERACEENCKVQFEKCGRDCIKQKHDCYEVCSNPKKLLEKDEKKPDELGSMAG